MAQQAGEEANTTRRQFERVSFGRSAELYEIDSYGIPSEGRPCELTDLSRSGAGVRCRRMSHAGCQVLILIQLPDGGRKVLFGVTRYSRYANRGLYHIGIAFEAMPETSELRRWLREKRVA